MKRQSRFATLGLLLFTGAASAQDLDPQEARLRAFPYTPKPAVTIRTRTELVEIGAVVRDSHGNAVKGLTKPDFEVRDDGKPREISAFSVQSFVPATSPAAAPTAAGGAAPVSTPIPQPRWLAMVFDDNNTPPADLYIAKAAAQRFLQDGLAASDRVAVITTSSALVLPFTADAARISEAIAGIDYRGRDLTMHGCPTLTPFDAYLIANGLDAMALSVKVQEYAVCSGTKSALGGGRRGGASVGGISPDNPGAAQVQAMARSLWEQLRIQSLDSLQTLESVVDFISHMRGQRVILVASSGFLSGTLERDQDFITDKALRANVVINSLDAKGLYTGLFSADMRMGEAGVASVKYHQQQGIKSQEALNDVLGNLAVSTGGQFFHNRNDLDTGFKQLGMQPEVSYLLAVTPETLDGRYHHLKVSLAAAKHFSVQARKGYVAAAEPPIQPQHPAERRLDSEVFTTSTLQEAPVTVSAIAERSPDGRQMARLTFHVDIGKAQFQDLEGVRTQKFRMIAALFDGQGAFVTGVEGLLELALKQASYQRFATPGFNADMRIPVPEGSYRLRTVIVEGGDGGRYSTATQTADFRSQVAENSSRKPLRHGLSFVGSDDARDMPGGASPALTEAIRER